MLSRAEPMLAITLLGLAMWSGCAPSTALLVTDPADAEVFLVTPSGGEKLLGKTPHTLRDGELDEANDKYVHLVLRRPDFQSQSLIVPRASIGITQEVRITMEKGNGARSMEAGACTNGEVADMGALTRGVAEAQRLLIKRDLQGAETQLQQLAARYPHISVVHDLLGNVYFLKKDNIAALKSYKRSLALWPHNPETKGMVENLEKIASAGQGG